MNRKPYKSVVSDEKASELEKLLGIAEDLKDKYEAKNRVIERYRLEQLTLLLLFIVVPGLVLMMAYSSLSDSARAIVLVLAMACIVYIIVLEYLVVRRAKAKIKPDLIALSRIVQLIRETEGALAESENWSTLERTQFRIRLSRFDIDYRN